MAEKLGLVLLCNGVDKVTAATRHNLMLGATQIKMAVSGGVISFTDPLYVNEFYEEEIRAAVRAAEDYGTYVMVHCHSSSAAQRALKAGVKSFDHMSCADEETMKMLADAGAVASVQLLVAAHVAETYPKGDPRQVKGALAVANARNALSYAKKHGLTLGWGTDLIDNAESRDQQLKDLTMRLDYDFTSAELMVQATGNGGKTVAMSGKRNPYGKVGVIEAGAMADMLIYSKNPLEDIKIIEDFETNLKLVIKDGDIVKNTL
jgi:imidazolonepropionase-like amidohydrolase